MEVKFWFVNDEPGMLVVIQVREEDEQFLDAVAFVAIKSISVARLAKHSARDEISRIPIKDDFAVEEVAQGCLNLNTEIDPFF